MNFHVLRMRGEEVSERDTIVKTLIRQKYDQKTRSESKGHIKRQPGYHGQTKAAAFQEVKTAQQQNSDQERLRKLLESDTATQKDGPIEPDGRSSELLRQSLLKDARVLGSSSTKLNYIVNEVRFPSFVPFIVPSNASYRFSDIQKQKSS